MQACPVGLRGAIVLVSSRGRGSPKISILYHMNFAQMFSTSNNNKIIKKY